MSEINCSSVTGALPAWSPHAREQAGGKGRVCYVTSVFPRYDGDRAASFLVEAIRRLRRWGYEISVFAPAFQGLGDHEVYGIRVRRFRYFLKRWEDLTNDLESASYKIRKPLYLFVAIFYILFGCLAVRRFSRAERFDLLHVHWPFPHGLFGILGARQNGAKILLSFHGAELLLARRFPFVNLALRWMLRRSNGVTANSSFTASQITRITSASIAIIPYGSTIPERPVPNAREKPLKEILFVGRLVERKGVEYLLQAMPLVLKEIPAHLYIVGDGPCHASLERLANTLNLGDAVVFTGVIPNEELAVRYESCDVFVLPSIVDSGGDTEGLGVVLIEALTYRKAVVASRVGGIIDVIKDGETGLLVPERDPGQLANALLRVLRDPALAHRLGEAGFQFAKIQFNWDRIAADVARVYDDLIGLAKLQPGAPGGVSVVEGKTP